MQKKKTLSIEEHALARKNNGGTGPLLEYSKLSAKDIRTISKEIFSTIGSSMGDKDPYEIYIEVMMKWGIMCPHPQYKRLYEGKHRMSFPTCKYRWFLCECCSSCVINDIKNKSTMITAIANSSGGIPS